MRCTGNENGHRSQLVGRERKGHHWGASTYNVHRKGVGSIENTPNLQTDSFNQFLQTKWKGRGQNSKSCGRHILWTSWLPALVHKLHSKKCTTVQWAHLPHWGRQLHFLLLSAHHVRGRNEFSGSLGPCDLYCIGGWTNACLGQLHVGKHFLHMNLDFKACLAS